MGKFLKLPGGKLAKLAELSFARIKSAFEMNNLQRGHVTLLHALRLAELSIRQAQVQKWPHLDTIEGQTLPFRDLRVENVGCGTRLDLYIPAHICVALCKARV
jgi:hypothetical protein